MCSGVTTIYENLGDNLNLVKYKIKHCGKEGLLIGKLKFKSRVTCTLHVWIPLYRYCSGVTPIVREGRQCPTVHQSNMSDLKGSVGSVRDTPKEPFNFFLQPLLSRPRWCRGSVTNERKQKRGRKGYQ